MIKLHFTILFFLVLNFCIGQTTTDLYVAVSGKTGGVIEKSDLLAFNELRLMNNKDSLYKIISFRFGITGAGTEYIDYLSDSNKLSDKMKEALRNVRSSGSKIWFLEIQCVGLNKDTIELQPFYFITKETSKSK